MNQYEDIDAAILRSIEQRQGTGCQFGPICRDTSTVVQPLAEATGFEEWRIVDRRLQALRRAGKILYTGRLGGWEIVKEPK